MHFTRDPIIETIISPRDGFKLSVRNPRAVNQEEYLVKALEVVSFGPALFFRSLENPKAFLLPVADYEVVEVKEARMVFKNVSVEKPIKIGEGKEAKAGDDDSSKKDKSENKKNSRKRTSRRKKSSQKTEQSASSEREGHSVKEVERSEPRKESVDAPKVPQPPVVPIVFPAPPKIIGRKIPTPSEEESSEKEAFSGEPRESSNSPQKESADAHHPKKEVPKDEMGDEHKSSEQSMEDANKHSS